MKNRITISAVSFPDTPLFAGFITWISIKTATKLIMAGIAASTVASFLESLNAYLASTMHTPARVPIRYVTGAQHPDTGSSTCSSTGTARKISSAPNTVITTVSLKRFFQ